jgi:hypothetical protein
MSFPWGRGELGSVDGCSTVALKLAREALDRGACLEAMTSADQAISDAIDNDILLGAFAIQRKYLNVILNEIEESKKVWFPLKVFRSWEKHLHSQLTRQNIHKRLLYKVSANDIRAEAVSSLYESLVRQGRINEAVDVMTKELIRNPCGKGLQEALGRLPEQINMKKNASNSEEKE